MNYHIKPNHTLGECKAKSLASCPYGAFSIHSSSKAELEDYIDIINENVYKYSARLKEGMDNGIVARKLEIWNENAKYTKYLKSLCILKSNNLNILSGRTKPIGYLGSISGIDNEGYHRSWGTLSDAYDEILAEKGEDYRPTVVELCERAYNNMGLYDFDKHTSGDKLADKFARLPEVNMEYADKEVFGMKTLYSTDSLSYGESAKYSDKVNKEGCKEIQKELNTILKDKKVPLEINQLFKVNEDPSLLLVFSKDKTEDERGVKRIFLIREKDLYKGVNNI